MDGMLVSDIMVRMIDFYNGSHHDINHMMKVHSFARMIGLREGLDAHTQTVLESAAILHDIACPLCREKYGSAEGRLQEKEGPALAETLLAKTEMAQPDIERIKYLVGHHHTLDEINGSDYQILIEADYLVNADESRYSKENINNMMERYFKTETGKELLSSIYRV